MKVKFKCDYVKEYRVIIQAGSVCEVTGCDETSVYVKNPSGSNQIIPLHAFNFCTEPYTEAKQGKRDTYPSNCDECFETIWSAKGKKGAKAKAEQKFKQYVVNSTDDQCASFMQMILDDFESQWGEVGFPELHLTTYLNQKRWEK